MELIKSEIFATSSAVLFIAIVLFLLVLFCVLLISMNKSVTTLVTKQNDLIKDTNKAIRDNTSTLKALDTTIKDRLLNYLESQIGANAKEQ